MQTIFQRLRALFSWAPVVSTPARPADLPDEVSVRGEPEWLKIARQDLGIKEFAGAAANPQIMRAWKYCDYDPPAGDETAWCSAKANEWIQRAKLPGTRAPNARSWATWGSTLAKPKIGCIVVFWRGSPTGWEGHVALYVGPGSRPGTIKVLGGNQSNGVTIQDYSVAQVISYRWPTTGGNSKTLKAQTAGLILGDGLTIASIGGKGVIESLPDALAIGDGVTALAAYWPWAALLGVTISILARMVTIYARVTDWQTKGV